MKKNLKKLEILEIGLVCLIFCILFYLGYKIYHMEKSIFDLQQDLNTINRDSGAVADTEYTQVINFLENEIVKFTEFVENQQAFLVQLIGIIGAFAIGLLTFLGIKGKEDISNIIQKKYANQVENELSSIIGGEDRIAYLKSCVDRQKKAESKKILFIFQEKEYEELMKVYRELKDGGFQVKKRSIDREVRDKEIGSWVRENDIIIYQVDDSEIAQDNDQLDENVTYARLARECNSKKAYGILYCKAHNGLVRKWYDSYFYISAANYGLTVMERIYNLLYFA